MFYADAGEYAEFLLMENLCPEFLRDVARDMLSCGLYVRMLKRCGANSFVHARFDMNNLSYRGRVQT